MPSTDFDVPAPNSLAIVDSRTWLLVRHSAVDVLVQQVAGADESE
jgi:hypothetical protein